MSSAPAAVPPSEPNQSLWFAEHVLPHEPALRAWLRARFPSLTDDEDVVQESYLRLMRIHGRRRIDNLKSYLFMIARNVVFDRFRRDRAAPIVPTDDQELGAVAEERTSVEESVCASQEFEILQEAIASLPEKCRRIMELRKLHGLANLEVADRLGLSVNTVNAQLVIGLARCRQYLLARGVLRGSRA